MSYEPPLLQVNLVVICYAGEVVHVEEVLVQIQVVEVPDETHC